ncbi:hypothetical protein [Lentibacillus sp. CBA3610]|uniref:hypothetical protein n=1 Tax=Lentibacillus sp. CBA3610 TaxID=2518176 RepID=UPI001594FE08|nr:hypothetical protein [Lentibacillus sp. CBA3610]QKY69440.1 hypothetical protein Len3610_07375 [Lentibacillus sp. CBA3610]
MVLPIDTDLLKKREEIPIKLAELSYVDSDQAINLLRKWGEKSSPITVLHEELNDSLKDIDSAPKAVSFN